MQLEKSKALWEAACNALAGGVNSPVRAFKAVGGAPFFAAEGQGPTVTDADGNTYIDYVLSWGPLVLGHAHPRVVEAVRAAAAKGASFGIPTEAETVLARKVMAHLPSIERIRFVNSGTEATMSALRLARGFTGREKVVKVEGGYHGHVDSLLAKAGSGPATLGIPTTPGVPEAYAQTTLTVPFNDLDAARLAFEHHGPGIACFILEPVAGNMGVIPPEPGYLEGLRELTRDHGALLIFDEVMTGFRVALGGAQQACGVTPDLTTLGKVIGGGMPVGAYGGSREIMDHLAPAGDVYQAGTLSGNPLATAAGIATLEVLEAPGNFERITARLTQLGEGLKETAAKHGIPLYTTQAGTMGCAFFHDGPVRNFAEAAESDTTRYARFFWAMLERGVYFAPSQFEACFLSLAHTEADIDRTLDAAEQVFAALA